MHNFPVLRTIASHFLALVVVVAVAAAVMDSEGAGSVLAGALVSFIPGTVFTLKYFRYSGARSVEKVVKNAFIAEVMKLVMMGVGFALVFRFYAAVRPLWVFVGFLVVHLASMVVAVRAARRIMV